MVSTPTSIKKSEPGLTPASCGTDGSSCWDGSLSSTTTTCPTQPEDMLHSTCHHWHSPTTATPTSSSHLCGDAAVLDSSGDSSSDNAVQELAELLRNAGTEYLRRIEDSSLSQTLSQDEEHVQDLIRDEPVKVEIPPNVLISAELLGEVGMVIKRSIPYRKLDVKYFSQSGLFVREVAAGVPRGQAVSSVAGSLGQFVLPHRRFAAAAINSVFGAGFTTAPNVTVMSKRQHQPTASSPIFFAEVEDGNRTLPALIRHCGALLVNFPHLNAVLGIKGENTNTVEPLRLNSLFLIQRDHEGGEPRQCRVTRLIDFGPDQLSTVKRDHAQRELESPLPPLGVKPVAGEHGAGVAAPAGGWIWERFVNGRENGKDKMCDLPVGLLLQGAHSRDNEPIADIPDVSAQINLGELADAYWY